MKEKENATSSAAAKSNWPLLALVAFSAAGAGVTGTLLWLQSRPAPAPSSVAAPSTPAAGALMPNASSANVSSANDASTTHEPPAALTAGMTTVQAALTLGNWYYDHERWPVAIAQYQKAIAGGLDNPNVRTDLGNCFRFSDQPQKALQQYLLAQKQNPQHEQSFFNQGGLYATSLKNPTKAVAVWREYLRRFPQGQSVNEARQLIARFESQPAAKP